MSGPHVTRYDFSRLRNLLKDNGFIKSKDIPMNNRKIRAICSMYPGRFLSTHHGYKLVSDASSVEIVSSIHSLRSRCNNMQRRIFALNAVLNKRQ